MHTTHHAIAVASSRWRIRRLAAVCLWLATGSVAWAGTPTPTPLAVPDVDIEVAGRVYAMVRQPGGHLVIGGSFTRVGGLPRQNIARILASGEVDPDWRPDADDTVLALAVAANGAIFASGDFSRIGGRNRLGLARLQGDGTGEANAAWNPAPDGSVTALLLQGSDLFVGGSFQTIGGQPRARLAKLASAGTGAVDPDWAPVASDAVLALAADGNGSLYVGGQFQYLGGAPRSRAARVSMAAPAVVHAWNPDVVGSYVSAIAIDAVGELYLGGNFWSVGGQGRRNLVKVKQDTGVTHQDWQVDVDGQINALALDAAGHLFIGGEFHQVDGQVRRGVARVLTNGGGSVDPAWDAALDDAVRALLSGTGGGVLIGGAFNAAAGQLHLGFVALDGNALPRPAVHVTYPGAVLDIAQQADGGLIVAGEFRLVDGLPRRVFRLRPDGEVDPDWNPDPNDEVLAVVVTHLGDVVLGGRFTSLGTAPRRFLTRVDGVTGQSLTWNSPTDGRVTGLLLDPLRDDVLYVTGHFNTLLVEPRNGIARVDPADGSMDRTWNPSPDGMVADIALAGADALYVVGAFSHIGGQPRAGAAKIGSTGSGVADPDWQPVFTGEPEDVVVDDAASVYVAGEFSAVNGEPRAGLVKLSASHGEVDAAWQAVVDGSVDVMLPDAAGGLYLAGEFVEAAGGERLSLARVAREGTGQLDPTWNPGASRDVYPAEVLVLQWRDDGALLVGGGLDEIGGLPRLSLAALPASSHSTDVIFASGFE